MRLQLKLPLNKYDWHSWFAWHPIFANHSIVWLEYVERKYNPELYYTLDFGGIFPEGGYEYR